MGWRRLRGVQIRPCPFSGSFAHYFPHDPTAVSAAISLVIVGTRRSGGRLAGMQSRSCDKNSIPGTWISASFGEPGRRDRSSSQTSIDETKTKLTNLTTVSSTVKRHLRSSPLVNLVTRLLSTSSQSAARYRCTALITPHSPHRCFVRFPRRRATRSDDMLQLRRSAVTSGPQHAKFTAFIVEEVVYIIS